MSLFTHKSVKDKPLRNQEWLMSIVHCIQVGEIKIIVRDGYPDHIQLLQDSGKINFIQLPDEWGVKDYELLATISSMRKGGEVFVSIVEGKITEIRDHPNIFPPEK